MRRVSKHVDVKQFCNVVVPRERVFLLEGCSDRCGLLLDEGPLVGQSLPDITINLGQGAQDRLHTLHDLIALIKAVERHC